MPKHNTHEFFGALFSIPLTFLYYKISKDISSSLVFLISMIFGVLFLSPDLDVKSKTYRRWSFLRFIWIPYISVMKHRSFLSHFPLISSLTRAAYLTFSITIVSALIIYSFTLIFIFLGINLQTKNPLSIIKESFFTTIRMITDVETKFIIAFILGISCGDTIHTILDTISTKIKRI